MSIAASILTDPRLAEWDALLFLVGYMLNWILFGILSGQVYLYYLAFPKDRYLSKMLVWGVYTLETVQTILISRDAFALYAYVMPVTLTKYAVPVLGGIVAFVVQVFYAYRLFILTKSKSILVSISLGAILQLLCASIGGVTLFTGPPRGQIKQHRAVLLVMWGVGGAFVDTTIAVLMMYHLLRRDSGWKSTHTLLVKLVRQAVGTGAVTTTVAIFYIICIYLPSFSSYWCIPSTILGKLYSNAMMVNFNHRVEFANSRMLQSSEMHSPSILFATNPPEPRNEN